MCCHIADDIAPLHEEESEKPLELDEEKNSFLSAADICNVVIIPSVIYNAFFLWVCT
jgi:hypothetical protein